MKRNALKTMWCSDIVMVGELGSQSAGKIVREDSSKDRNEITGKEGRCHKGVNLINPSLNAIFNLFSSSGTLHSCTRIYHAALQDRHGQIENIPLGSNGND